VNQDENCKCNPKGGIMTGLTFLFIVFVVIWFIYSSIDDARIKLLEDHIDILSKRVDLLQPKEK
jgi:tetrahydromethanopterin S-methyltransferase subunit E